MTWELSTVVSLHGMCRVWVLLCTQWCLPLSWGHPIEVSLGILAFFSIESETGPHRSMLLALLVTTTTSCCDNQRYVIKRANSEQERTVTLVLGSPPREPPPTQLVRPSSVIHPIVTKNPFMPILGSIRDYFPIVLRLGLPWTASNLVGLYSHQTTWDSHLSAGKRAGAKPD